MNEAIIEWMKVLATVHNMAIHQFIRKGELNQTTISELMNGRAKYPKMVQYRGFVTDYKFKLVLFSTVINLNNLPSNDTTY